MVITSMGAMQRATKRSILLELGTVWGEDSVTGRYTVLLKRDLACRLVIPAGLEASSGDARAEMVAQRDLWFDPAYDMPEQCQVEVDGVRWQPQPGSFHSPGDGVTPTATVCIVDRQQTAAFT